MSKTYTVCGSAEYMAPEMVVVNGHGPAVDAWALGVLLVEMLTGTSPYRHAAKAAHGPFDAAVVDLHLGDGPEGFAVIDWLRPHGVRRIALVTADTRDGLNEQATAAGAVLLPKPIKPAALKAFLSS